MLALNSHKQPLMMKERRAVAAIFAPAEAVVANPVAAVLVGLVASPVVVVGPIVAMPAAVVVELVANPAAAEVEMVVAAEGELVVNTGRTVASFGAVPPPVVKQRGAIALHRRLRRTSLTGISRSRGRLP